MKVRIVISALLATLVWFPQSAQNVSAIFCYPGDPPAVYQACVAYNGGIGQQVSLRRFARQRELHPARAHFQQHEPADEPVGRCAAGRGL
ncbi:MAG: hypothetical protein E6I17_02410 [Chloroflexi bacterium]|nr:MAG: hypothetical protein E6I17_02410 [Chloroflexota bacterium]